MISGPYIAARDTSLSGHGAFAVRDIPEGTIVHSLTGRPIHRTQLDTIDLDEVGVLQIDDDLFMVAQGNADDYINHSCEPNLAFTEDGRHFIALRAIQAGEEVTFDYATAEDDPEWNIQCLCGSEKCRGSLTGFPLLTLSQQRALYPLCRPYLRRKYEFILKQAA